MSKIVLVVEDEKELCDSIAETLESYDVIVEKAYSAEAAWKILESKTISLMISDIRLPDMDGIELIEKLGREDNPCSTFFIMSGYSGHSMDDVLAAGASYYYKKPGDIEKLIDDAVELIQQPSELSDEIA